MAGYNLQGKINVLDELIWEPGTANFAEVQVIGSQFSTCRDTVQSIFQLYDRKTKKAFCIEESRVREKCVRAYDYNNCTINWANARMQNAKDVAAAKTAQVHVVIPEMVSQVSHAAFDPETLRVMGGTISSYEQSRPVEAISEGISDSPGLMRHRDAINYVNNLVIDLKLKLTGYNVMDLITLERLEKWTQIHCPNLSECREHFLFRGYSPVFNVMPDTPIAGNYKTESPHPAALQGHKPQEWGPSTDRHVTCNLCGTEWPCKAWNDISDELLKGVEI